MLQQGSLWPPCLCMVIGAVDWSQVEINATPRAYHPMTSYSTIYLLEEPPLDPLLEPLLDEPLSEAPPPVDPLLDEPLPDPDEPPVPNELPDEPLLEGLVEEDPPDEDFSVDELRPEEEAPLPDELLSLLEEAPLDDEPLPLPEASTPSALAVLSSRRPVACIPLSF